VRTVDALSGTSVESQKSLPFIITYTVKCGEEEEYEHWLCQLLEAASRFPGYLGSEIFQPAQRTDPHGPPLTPALLLAVPPPDSRSEFLHTSKTIEFVLDFSTGLMIWCGKTLRAAISGFEDRVQRWRFGPFSRKGFYRSPLRVSWQFVFGVPQLCLSFSDKCDGLAGGSSLPLMDGQMLQELPFSRGWTAHVGNQAGYRVFFGTFQ
jgi:hypothetical protein